MVAARPGAGKRMHHINYKHLHHFWVVAKEGGIARASEALHLTPQTLSEQIKELEAEIGGKLFVRYKHWLQLTDIGQIIFGYADEMFNLGAELIHALESGIPSRPTRLVVGISDAVPKLIAYRLLDPVFKGNKAIRLVCHEGGLDQLLTGLTGHQLDIVLSDSPVNSTMDAGVHTHVLGESGVSFFGVELGVMSDQKEFPASLDGLPMLLPAAHTALRRALDLWFERYNIKPVVIGEFDDSALMNAFGQGGAGIFPASSIIEDEIQRQYNVKLAGSTDEITETFYAISLERKIEHPAIKDISETARRALFGVKPVRKFRKSVKK
jgi:LysR family transcriptional activator of nhaA